MSRDRSALAPGYPFVSEAERNKQLSYIPLGRLGRADDPD